MLIEQFLKVRNLDLNTIEEMKKPLGDDVKMKDVDVLAQELHKIHESQEQLVIMPDTDADGIMSGVIGLSGLSELGFNVALYCPENNGVYGMTAAVAKDMLSKFPDVKHVITCDTGISDFEGINVLNYYGINVLVTDHHTEKEENRGKNKATVIVNPNKLDDPYPLQICGAFVLYKCLVEYASTYRDQQMVDRISKLIVFAGVGTVGDVMPIRSDNTIAVERAIDIFNLLNNDNFKSKSFGEHDYGKGINEYAEEDYLANTGLNYFKELPSGSDMYLNSVECDSALYKRAFRGIQLLIDANVYGDMHTKGKQKPERHKLDESYFGFTVAPCINSYKRMGVDTYEIFGLFFGDLDYSKSRASATYALNTERKEVSETYTKAISEQSHPFEPYLYVIPNIRKGFTGLLANNLMTKSHMPTFVVNNKGDDNTRFYGSGRTPKWFNGLELLLNIDPDFPGDLTTDDVSVSGHANAFGFNIDIDKAQAFVDYIEFIIDKKTVNGEDLSDEDYDIEIDINNTDLTVDDVIEFVREVDFLGPFGADFRAPTFKLKFKMDDAANSYMGHKGQHAKFQFSENFSAIVWNKQQVFIDELDKLPLDFSTGQRIGVSDVNITIIGQLDINEFRDNVSVNLIGSMDIELPELDSTEGGE